MPKFNKALKLYEINFISSSEIKLIIKFLSIFLANKPPWFKGKYKSFSSVDKIIPKLS